MSQCKSKAKLWAKLFFSITGSFCTNKVVGEIMGKGILPLLQNVSSKLLVTELYA